MSTDHPSEDVLEKTMSVVAQFHDDAQNMRSVDGAAIANAILAASMMLCATACGIARHFKAESDKPAIPNRAAPTGGPTETRIG